jgi:hypothetical protein
MDIPRPDNFNETYLYEGMFCSPLPPHRLATAYKERKSLDVLLTK